LQQRLGLTTIFVTHDQEEALAIADRMAIMHDGKVQQVGAPQALYERPANLFVADFLGKMNFFKGKSASERSYLSEKGSSIAVGVELPAATHLGVRPERVTLSSLARGENALPGTVESAVYLGPLLDVRVRLDSGELVSSQIANNQVLHDTPIAPGARVHACFEPGDCVLFTQ